MAQSSEAALLFQRIQVSPALINKPTKAKEPGYKPTEFDVLCGRGSSFFLHKGNQRFRLLIQEYQERYALCKTKMDKSAVVFEIVASVRQSGGAFLRMDKEREWHDIGDKLARDKVGHTLRGTKPNNGGNVRPKGKRALTKKRQKLHQQNSHAATSNQEISTEQHQQQDQQNQQPQQQCLTGDDGLCCDSLEPLPMTEPSSSLSWGLSMMADNMDGFAETMVDFARENAAAAKI